MDQAHQHGGVAVTMTLYPFLASGYKQRQMGAGPAVFKRREAGTKISPLARCPLRFAASCDCRIFDLLLISSAVPILTGMLIDQIVAVATPLLAMQNNFLIF